MDVDLSLLNCFCFVCIDRAQMAIDDRVDHYVGFAVRMDAGVIIRSQQQISANQALDSEPRIGRL